MGFSDDDILFWYRGLTLAERSLLARMLGYDAADPDVEAKADSGPLLNAALDLLQDGPGSTGKTNKTRTH
ncbi:hypothetical protein [uncultured Maritimibacter sp.]|uniref:hypothetical protein n=1 Tax=uncultured Maritimibacter sp. TaxID=991866 RepID=UPI002604FC06|nr:hypothetical protein [uncultured Maritimibacter sp.]